MMKPRKDYFWDYTLDRPLSRQERRDQLFQSQPSGVEPFYQGALIQMNSTWLECVERYHDQRGTKTAFCLFGLVFLGGFAGAATILLVFYQWPTLSLAKKEEATLAFFWLYVFYVPMLTAGFVLLKREIFRYTHYPIRFNRRTRKVYGFRWDGTVMVADWDKLVVTVLKPRGYKNNYTVCLHRMDETGEIVLDTFGLPAEQARDSPHLLKLWEFIRRYMEEGPENLVDQVIGVHTVNIRREGYWRGFWVMISNDLSFMPPLIAWLISPLMLIYAVGRWLASHTSKIPKWPEEVEAECAIDPDDPYVRDAHTLASKNYQNSFPQVWPFKKVPGRFDSDDQKQEKGRGDE